MRQAYQAILLEYQRSLVFAPDAETRLAIYTEATQSYPVETTSLQGWPWWLHSIEICGGQCDEHMADKPSSGLYDFEFRTTDRSLPIPEFSNWGGREHARRLAMIYHVEVIISYRGMVRGVVSPQGVWRA